PRISRRGLDICFRRIYFPETYRSLRENPRFRTHFLTLNPRSAEFTGTARGTFASYAGRGKAPVPAAKLHGLNPRNSDDVREWQKGHEAKGK
ncbi:hypothetical protein JY506_11470, partial [Corynebacterium amycolatum]|nr:hypothetical protein [Corynebacterium amycolatum]